MSKSSKSALRTKRRSPKLHDLTGETFGRWTVVGRAESSRTGVTRWLCRCQCGTMRPVFASNLRRSLTVSCGCHIAEKRASLRRTHGQSRTPEHGIWLKMISRCHHPNDIAYPLYGARGIKVCDRWRWSLTAFLADMGARPSVKHTIDRINNDGDYEPGNCRWATALQQARNTRKCHRITFDGQTKCLTEWSEATGISQKTILTRLRTGWPVALALTVPVKRSVFRLSALLDQSRVTTQS